MAGGMSGVRYLGDGSDCSHFGILVWKPVRRFNRVGKRFLEAELSCDTSAEQKTGRPVDDNW